MLLKIVHSEIVEQMFGLLTKVLDSVFLFCFQFVFVLRLSIGSTFLLVEHTIFVNTKIGGNARHVDSS